MHSAVAADRIFLSLNKTNMIACRYCGSVEVTLLKYEFVNHTHHIKLTCHDCRRAYFAPKTKEYLLAVQSLPFTTSKIEKMKRTKLKQQEKTMTKEELQKAVINILALDSKDDIEFLKKVNKLTYGLMQQYEIIHDNN